LVAQRLGVEILGLYPRAANIASISSISGGVSPALRNSAKTSSRMMVSQEISISAFAATDLDLHRESHLHRRERRSPKRPSSEPRATPAPAFDANLTKCKADTSWKTSEMACGHDAMVVQPEQLAGILLEVA
jgi:hypothetical protein